MLTESVHYKEKRVVGETIQAWPFTLFFCLLNREEIARLLVDCQDVVRGLNFQSSVS